MNTMITAHSGADGTADNSWEFVYHALTGSADALEVDVRMAEDGVLRLGHNDTSPSAPSLEGVFEMLSDSNLKINCDLKEPKLEKKAAQLAKDAGILGRLVFSGSVDPARVPEGICVFWNIEECVRDVYERCPDDFDYRLEAAEAACKKCKEAGISVLNVYERIADDKFLEILAENGIDASVWTVDEAERIGYFIKKGVKNITTMQTLKAAALLKELG